jgi:predicted RNase H-like HicB family nuclease
MVEVSIQIQKNDWGYTAYSPEISEQRVQGTSLDSVVNTMKEMIRDYLDQDSPPVSIEEAAHQPIWETALELTSDMTEAELRQLPSDGAEQHDHYIYGTPKHS